ncbi:MAG: hypothetical protein SNJ73_08480 [Acetobacteraceae bacterium]
MISSAVVGSSAIKKGLLHAEGERGHHALPHPVGELVRIVVDTRCSSRDAHLVEHREVASPRLGRRHRQVDADRFDELLADGEQWIE